MQLPTGKYPINDLVGLPLETIERLVILETLQRNGGNRTKTALVLGVCIRTLRAKLKKYRNEEYLDAKIAA